MNQYTELAEKLSAYAERHRMMFGLTEDYKLIAEAVYALQAIGQENEAPKPTRGRPKKESE